MRIPFVVFALLSWWVDAAAQSGARAAATITEADVRRRVNLIADDSMGGRDTPSPGLETTARYLASEFGRMGLRPAGDSGTYFQRYGIRIRDTDAAGSSISFIDPNGAQTKLGFAADAKLVNGAPPAPVVTADLVLGGGNLGPSGTLPEESVKGRILIWVADWKNPQVLPSIGQTLIAAANAGARLLVLSVNDDSAFAKLPTANQNNVSAEAVGWPAVIAVREAAVVAAIPEAEATLSQVRSATAPTALEAPGWTSRLELSFSKDERHSIPNVVGIVPGTDPALAGEYVAISAHFDHVGSRCRGATGADKICNGADDNASGTTGLLELAEAFAHPDAKPRRSILLVAVSGEERGLWGSEYYAENPTVPIDRIIANINMDHLGRNWRDSIAVIGREHSDLGATVDRVAGEHRELGVGVLPDQWPQERIYFRSDHYNFAKEGVPILFFTNGFHGDYHAVTDSPDKIDAEKQARVVKLIFHTVRDVANRTERPRWNPESEKEIVKRKRAAIP